ncbi:MAG: Cys-tRNA(Pro) deacylase [Chloroflexi bacterium]|jgi:Cys-tRNA(Pro)/Cys-tRNA(Cys) deacylase|nr:Cys-tRNA(Pro) deacylase [Chloroflexota bacterium]MBT4004104.1 Cys-tRNA(Pro) deacylase [Chloroflexota bacterium]MBT4305781.1 Cys-tRNA(Pro) deacylase [Chloroflexota bacterium]MBT4533605.1 Cys-tRNA(Pro) deacylase [Chloroflexota bacterium]MBT4681752.1 Cys-tRNA(Pro) deacylase [Chloroflexota bacterium]
MKNNVTRLLDSKKVSFKVHISPNEKRSALETSAILGVDANQVYKTIVALRPNKGKPILAIIPGPLSLNLKLLAKALGEKKVVLSTHSEAEKITGLQTGGISPLALINKGFQVVLDSSAMPHETIFVSGGQRGLTVELSPNDLLSLIRATTAEISKIRE